MKLVRVVMTGSVFGFFRHGDRRAIAVRVPSMGPHCAKSITSQVMEATRRLALWSRMTPAPTIGNHLREWRQRRRMSQLELALEADISTRHLSFLETGRSSPSRDMVLHLA